MGQITIINPHYPYGKNQTFLSGSVVSIAARLMAMGYLVKVLDLNLDRLESIAVQTILKTSEFIGISLTGAPYIPSVMDLIRNLRSAGVHVPVMLGGQAVEHLTPQQFDAVYDDYGKVWQVKNDADLAEVLGCEVESIPSPMDVSYQAVWREMGTERLTTYLRNEGALVLSQGCGYQCKFCSACKGTREKFRSLELFEKDLRFLADTAREAGIQDLSFYASSLDFFQNPHEVERHLQVLAEIQRTCNVRIRVRCLSCLKSFLRAGTTIKEFGDLLHRAGLWCVGFGVDGTDESVWRAQGKTHNNMSDVNLCLKMCNDLGIQTEILMIFGFSEDTARTIGNVVLTSLIAAWRWPLVVLRPYLAKETVPGNEGWKLDTAGAASVIIADPKRFYDLDYCAIGSHLTHTRTWHRYLCNTSYLAICALLTPFGKCVTSPLLPQGESGLYGRVAKLVNRLMPFDR